MTIYSLASHSIDMIPKALSLLRRRLIKVRYFSAHTDNDGTFRIAIRADIPTGHEHRFMKLFEKIYEVDAVEYHEEENIV